MNNFKKVGLTALAGSLIVVSAHAGEMSVAGGQLVSVLKITVVTVLLVNHGQWVTN